MTDEQDAMVRIECLKIAARTDTWTIDSLMRTAAKLEDYVKRGHLPDYPRSTMSNEAKTKP